MTVKLFSCCPYCNAPRSLVTPQKCVYECGTTGLRETGARYVKKCGRQV